MGRRSQVRSDTYISRRQLRVYRRSCACPASATLDACAPPLPTAAVSTAVLCQHSKRESGSWHWALHGLQSWHAIEGLVENTHLVDAF